MEYYVHCRSFFVVLKHCRRVYIIFWTKEVCLIVSNDEKYSSFTKLFCLINSNISVSHLYMFYTTVYCVGNDQVNSLLLTEIT